MPDDQAMQKNSYYFLTDHLSLLPCLASLLELQDVASLGRETSGLAGDILTLASEDRESVASRGIVDPIGDKMELQGTAAEFRAISGSAVVEESVPNEDAAGLHGHRDDAGMGHVSVTDLPVPAPEVHRGAPSRWLPGMTCMQPFSGLASSRAIHTLAIQVPIGRLK